MKSFSQILDTGQGVRYLSKERKKEKKKEGGKLAGSNEQCDPSSCPHQGGRDRKQIGSPTPTASVEDEKVLIPETKSILQYFFSFTSPSPTQTPVQEVTTTRPNVLRALLTDRATRKGNISKNIMMLAGKRGFRVHRNSRESLFGEMFL